MKFGGSTLADSIGPKRCRSPGFAISFALAMSLAVVVVEPAGAWWWAKSKNRVDRVIDTRAIIDEMKVDATCPDCISSGNAMAKPRELYRAVTAFDMGRESLCFVNYGFKSGPYPLDKLATKWGACQGMIGLARGFKTHATFRCGGKKMNVAQVRTAIARVMEFQKNGCDRKVEITGACGLRELCEANKSEFNRSAVEYNADLTIQDTLGHVAALLAGKTAGAQERNAHALRQIHEDLAVGRQPMILYPFHVILVTGMRIIETKKGWEARLTTYNPNRNSGPSTYTLELTPDLSRTVGEKPIFVVTPEPDEPTAKCDQLRETKDSDLFTM